MMNTSYKSRSISRSNVLLIAMLGASFSAFSADEWKPIGSTDDGYVIFATQVESQPDGSLRMFLKGEKQMEREPKGLLSIFSKPEKYVEKSSPFGVLVHCKKRAVRNYVPGDFGKEFYEPWQPPTPGTSGALAFNAFCKH